MAAPTPTLTGPTVPPALPDGPPGRCPVHHGPTVDCPEPTPDTAMAAAMAEVLSCLHPSLHHLVETANPADELDACELCAEQPTWWTSGDPIAVVVTSTGRGEHAEAACGTCLCYLVRDAASNGSLRVVRVPFGAAA